MRFIVKFVLAAFRENIRTLGPNGGEVEGVLDGSWWFFAGSGEVFRYTPPHEGLAELPRL